jgi:hypothetical protein
MSNNYFNNLTGNQIHKIHKMANEGAMAQDIAAEFGVSKSAMSNWMKKLGISVAVQGRPRSEYVNTPQKPRKVLDHDKIFQVQAALDAKCKRLGLNSWAQLENSDPLIVMLKKLYNADKQPDLVRKR